MNSRSLVKLLTYLFLATAANAQDHPYQPLTEAQLKVYGDDRENAGYKRGLKACYDMGKADCTSPGGGILYCVPGSTYQGPGTIGPGTRGQGVLGGYDFLYGVPGFTYQGPGTSGQGGLGGYDLRYNGAGFPGGAIQGQESPK